MKISELVAALEKVKSEHGDVDVYSTCDWDFVTEVEFHADSKTVTGLESFVPDAPVVELI